MIKRPMKGYAIKEEDFDRLVYPLFASPKIDGFRCILGDRPYTSTLSEFRNPFVNRRLSGLLDDHLLDGELVVGKKRGKGVLARTSSGLTNGAGKPDFKLWCFDTPQVGYRFADRLKLTRQIVKQLDHPRIRFLPHEFILNPSDLEAYLAYCLREQYEGIIVRSEDGPYKEGKSTVREGFMLKVKPFEDAEGRIEDWFEEMENTNEAERKATGKLKRSSAKAGKVAKGTLGGFILRDCATGELVRVGGGFSKKARIGLWRLIQADGGKSLKGRLVRYKKQATGQKNKPRHPNFVDFVDFRPEWDFTG